MLGDWSLGASNANFVLLRATDETDAIVGTVRFFQSPTSARNDDVWAGSLPKLGAQRLGPTDLGSEMFFFRHGDFEMRMGLVVARSILRTP
jgi:hypothetical protein